MAEENWVIVTPTKASDQSARLMAEPVGTGFRFTTEITGGRSSKRREWFGMSRHQADLLIRQLGGTPPTSR